MNGTPPLLLESTKDALLVIEAAERGLFPRLVRRLAEQERADLIRSGSVFVYDEFESGIRRFTDALVWSPSRIVGNYLVYREMRRHEPRPTSRAGAALPPQPASARSLARPRPGSVLNESEKSRKRREQLYVGSLTNSEKFKPEGLVKRTFSLMCEGKHIHVIAYYTYDDAMNERFETPSEHKEFADLSISHELLRDPSAYRIPPEVGKLSNGQVTYIGEGSVLFDIDRHSSAETASTRELSEFPTLPPINTPEGSMFDLPPLRPIHSRPNWDQPSTPSPSAYDGPAYSTESYSFSNTLVPSLATISVPSLTPPPTRPVSRLRDARQQPYQLRPVGISRAYREAERTPTTAVGEESPTYQASNLWLVPSRREEGIASPAPALPPLSYEVGPSGETVKYEVPEGHWTPNSGMVLLYAGSLEAETDEDRNGGHRGGYQYQQ
ncbi:hypothetical protein FRC10_001882 [Ceratobasidium sp. 414]|nr:hypothetical protein FRC10_001882 [Ceratobasidium sp. 414]